MQTQLRGPSSILALALSLFSANAESAGSEVTATRSFTVQPSGPREGDAGTRFFNVEGKLNGRFASYGLITFPAPATDEKAGRIEGLTLTLVQSIPPFAKDGKLRFFLVDSSPLDAAGLRFDEASAGGLGGKFEGRCHVGRAEFKKLETGHADTFSLMLDEDARKLLEGRLEGKGELHVLIVPDDDGVAATYFGAGEEETRHRPRLTLKLASP